MHINTFLYLLILSSVIIAGGVADTNLTLTEENSTLLNTSISNPLSLNTTDLNLTDTGSENQTANMSMSPDSGNLSVLEEGESEEIVDGEVEIFTGTEHPNEIPEVQSSTPSGDPLLGTYALGGVSIDIGASIMEGRGSDTNVSSEISLQDHTRASGYIRTIQKDFHYVSSTDDGSLI